MSHAPEAPTPAPAPSPAPSPAPAREDTDAFRLPRRLSSWLASLVAISLLPTGAAGGVFRYMQSMSDKLDAIGSRLDRLEGAGTVARVDEHERRLRDLETENASMRAVVNELQREREKGR